MTISSHFYQWKIRHLSMWVTSWPLIPVLLKVALWIAIRLIWSFNYMIDVGLFISDTAVFSAEQSSFNNIIPCFSFLSLTILGYKLKARNHNWDFPKPIYWLMSRFWGNVRFLFRHLSGIKLMSISEHSYFRI